MTKNFGISMSQKKFMIFGDTKKSLNFLYHSEHSLGFLWY